MAAGAVPGETPDSWKPFCTCSQTAALGRGSPSAATATEAGLARPAGSPGLILRLKKQHKARSHLCLPLLSLLPFPPPGGRSLSILFHLAYCQPSGTHTRLPTGSLEGPEKTLTLF